MAKIYIGSARIGENGSIVGGKDGDQKQQGTNDMVGEVSSQAFYIHKKGWDIIRPINVELADNIAKENKYACDNAKIGYNQNERYDIVNLAKKAKSLKDISVPCNSDCSSLTRAEIFTSSGKDVGDFTTANCKSVLVKSKMFVYVGKYVSQEKTPIYNGDILCTCTKGHVVTVNNGSPRVTEPKASSTTQPKGSAIVKKCQQWLNTFSCNEVKEDGFYGTETKVAIIKTLQTILKEDYRKSVKVTGKYDLLTSTNIVNCKKGDYGRLVKLVECYLFLTGYNPQEFNGNYIDAVKDSVLEYQNKHGLEKDGVWGKQCWGKALK